MTVDVAYHIESDVVVQLIRTFIDKLIKDYVAIYWSTAFTGVNHGVSRNSYCNRRGRK